MNNAFWDFAAGFNFPGRLFFCENFRILRLLRFNCHRRCPFYFNTAVSCKVCAREKLPGCRENIQQIFKFTKVFESWSSFPLPVAIFTKNVQEYSHFLGVLILGWCEKKLSRVARTPKSLPDTKKFARH